MKALIVANGQVNNNYFKFIYKKFDFIVCVDGGTKYFRENKLYPNIFIGDFDSCSLLDKYYIKNSNVKVLKFPKKKDYTDSELAFKYLKKNKINKVLFIGGTGLRLDHTYSNINLLYKYYHEGLEIYLKDKNNFIFYTEKDFKVKKRKGYISIFSPKEDEVSISIDGCEYNLENEKIDFGSSVGVSNKIKKKFANIRFHKNGAIFFISKD